MAPSKPAAADVISRKMSKVKILTKQNNCHPGYILAQQLHFLDTYKHKHTLTRKLALFLELIA